jgi:conjugative relaxase-like TrwC/TraI family protein
MKFTITALGGAGQPLARIVGAIVRYLQPVHGQEREPPTAPGAPDEKAGTASYYADRGESPGRWLGRGAALLGLEGVVQTEDFSRVLAGRDPRTGERLLTAQGSAGRRPRLGVGTVAWLGPDGEPLYGVADIASLLKIEKKEAAALLASGVKLAVSRFLGLGAAAEPPEESYLVPFVDAEGVPWVSDAELSRLEDALVVGASVAEIAETGPAEELLPLARAAELVGVTPRYLRQLAERYAANRDEIQSAAGEGHAYDRAYLVAERATKGRWQVTRGELVAYVRRRRPPAVRVAYDVTLTTEKSLGVLALLGADRVRRGVLDAIQAGNDWAIEWLQEHAAAARVNDQIVPVKGLAVASFRHLTSRALDPFPHHHNLIMNSVEDLDGNRRALFARGLYRDIKAASAVATAEMRWQLTRRLGVRWRPSRHGGWEVAGIPEEVLRAFSRRRGEIEEALRELEQLIGRRASLDEVGQVVLKTRPGKRHTPVDELVAEWWERAEALGCGPDDLARCVGEPIEPPEPDVESLLAALAASDGICENVSVFHYGDVLAALANLPVSPPDGEGEPQPLLVPASRLEELAADFLRSRHVEQVALGTLHTPARYSTREMLAVQDRIMTRYDAGLRQHAGTVPIDVLEKALARHPELTGEQHALVRALCTSGHRQQCAIGLPGAGKTTAMAAARDAWQAAGWNVVGAAVKGEAARTLGTKAGIPTETLAWYLAHPDPMTAPLDARTVLIVDEASTISDRDIDRLAWMAEQTGATLRLIGDPEQHGAVEAGGMFRVLCERHEYETPQLTVTHRLRDPYDLAAAQALRAGDVEEALHQLDLAGHLHLVEDELHAFTEVLVRWWEAHRAGHDHPMVNRRNSVRLALNRLARQLRRAAGEIGHQEIIAAEDRRFAIGDRVIARAPNRDLHPPQRPNSYVRNGAIGTVTALRPGRRAAGDVLVVDFDGVGRIDIPRSFFDEHDVGPRHRDVGLDHAYALTSYAVTGATHAVSTSRIDQTSSRAETYVDITRGQHANHLYLTHADDPLDGEALPRTPPDPLDEAIATRLAGSIGERTAWELRQDLHERMATARGSSGIGL